MMTPSQKVGVYQHIAQMFVGGANGDPALALDHAQKSPGLLKSFGVTADELNGFIGSAAQQIQAKRDAGDAQGAEHLLSSFAALTPEAAAATVKQVHRAVSGGGASATQQGAIQAQDEYDHLHNDLHMTDAQIAKRYTIPATIKRVQ